MVAKRKPLTPHQREILLRLQKLSMGAPPSKSSAWPAARWVPLDQIGSRTACEHLVRKGYAEPLVERGPRGGEVRSYRPARGAVR